VGRRRRENDESEERVCGESVLFCETRVEGEEGERGERYRLEK